ncbi:IS4 family transposase [Nocardia acidivorans]|uniref:IS4 family transposase n=1 Tax=Nocardia acidivorans TaxID=404580 RepID=UPI0008331208|nr:IS4 family transposase [Nocardia acidivorans]
MDIPDTADNEEVFGRGKTHQSLDDPYPKVRVVGLGECATRAIVDARIGAVSVGERELTRPLLDAFTSDMLVIADRGFFGHEFWREAVATGADLLWRVQSGLKLHVVEELPDGWYLPRLMTDVECQRIRRHRSRGLDTPPEGVTVRVVEYEVTNRDSDAAGPIRLITTLLDPEEVTAAELAAAYHLRWEFETSLAEIETRQRGSFRLLRSHSPAMVRQEIWSFAADPLHDPRTHVSRHRPRYICIDYW